MASWLPREERTRLFGHGETNPGKVGVNADRTLMSLINVDQKSTFPVLSVGSKDEEADDTQPSL